MKKGLRYTLAWAVLLLPRLFCQAAVLAPLDGTDAPSQITTELFRYRAQLDRQALDVLRAASRLDGHDEIVDLQTLADRVLLMARRGLRAQALRVAEQFVALSPDTAEAHRLLGHVFYLLKDYDKALSPLQHAMKMAPQDIAARLLVSATLMALDRAEDALGVLRDAQRHFPPRMDLHHNAGVILLHLGRPEEALEELERACALQPDSAGSHHDRGLALEVLNRHEEAIVAFERARSLAPDHLPTRLNLTEAYLAKGAQAEQVQRLLTAEAAYRRALEVMPDEPEIQLRLAWVLILQRANLDEALALSEAAHHRAEQASPRSLQIWSAAQALNGQWAEAAQTALRGATLAEGLGNYPLAETLYTDWQLYQLAATAAENGGPD